MIDKTKNLLFIILLITISVFVGIGTAKAADTIKIDRVVAGHGVNFRVTKSGVAAYSYGSLNSGPQRGDKMTLHSTHNKGYYLYILNDKKIAGSDAAKARAIRQKALWKIRGFAITGDYVSEANNLVSAAKKAGTNYVIDPRVSTDNTVTSFSKSGKYYFSNNIPVNFAGTDDSSYKVTFSGAPSGTQVINKNNTSFQVRIPVDKVKNTSNFKIRVTGSIGPHKYVKQYHKDSNTDDVLILYSTYKNPTKVISASINPSVADSSETATSEGKFKVTLYIVPGKTHNVVEVKSGSKMPKPIDPTREGYKFLGWYTDDTYQVRYNFNNPVTSGLELYAKWDLLKYTVTYNSNGGSKVSSSKVYYNQEVSKPNDPSKAGYIFAGWYKDSNFENKFSFLTSIKKNTTLYARWVTEKPNTHDVTFVSGFNIDPIIVEVPNGEKVSAPLVTNSQSDNLDGWYTDSSKQNKFDISNTPITGDLVLYAKWLTASGDELYETPDTASPAKIIVLVAGCVLFLGGSYVIYRQYGRDFFKRKAKAD